MTDERLNHPHLDGLIRKWREEAASNRKKPFRVSSEVAMCNAIDDCADELEKALAALPGGGVEELRAALQPFADLAQLFDEGMRGGNMPGKNDDDPIMEWPRVNANYLLTVGHLRTARSLLTPTPTPHEADRNG